MTPTDLLDRQKEELFVKLKEVGKRLSYKQYEEKAIRAALDQKLKETGIDGKKLRRRLRYLEFRIQTDATTLQKERRYMREINQIEKQLDKVKETEKMDRKLNLVRGDISRAEEEIRNIKKQIDQIKAEIRAFREEGRKAHIEAKQREWQEKKRAELMKKKAQRKKEMDAYSPEDELDGGVELGSIAIIKKKTQSAEAEENSS